MSISSTAEAMVESSDEPRADFGAWWLAVLLALYFALSYIDRVILVHLVDMMRPELGITDFQVGLLLGPAFAIAYAIAGYPFGWATDRFPRRWILFFGVFGWSVATMMMGFADSYPAVVGCRVAVAVAEAALMPTAASMLVDRFPTGRLATGMAVYNMGPKSGETVAYLAAGGSIALAHTLVANGASMGHSAWQLVMLMVGAPGLLLAFLAFTVPEPARRNVTKADAADADGSFSHYLRTHARFIVPLFLGFCVAGIAATALVSWVPAFLGRTYGWNATQYGPWMGALTAIGAFSVLVKGAIMDWLYNRGVRDAAIRFYTWLLIGSYPFGLLAFFSPNPYIFFAAYFVVSLVCLPFLLYAITSLQLFVPKQFRGRTTGLFMLILPIFSTMIGPPVTAALTDFVFRDPAKVGLSLTIVAGVCMPIAFVLLRYAMRQLAGQSKPTLPDGGRRHRLITA